MKKVLISGVKPTGRPHLGNYFGAMKQFVDLQDEYNSHIFIADLHALTITQDPHVLKQNIIDQILDYLAIGLDPKKQPFLNNQTFRRLQNLLGFLIVWFQCLI